MGLEPEDVADVFNMASTVLEEVNNIYDEFEGVEGVEPLPDRQYISVSGPQSTPHDCEQVVMSISQLYTGIPGVPDQEPSRCGGHLTVTLFCEIVRNTGPDINPRARPAIPTVENENRIAKTQAVDLRLLLEAGRRAADAMSMGSIATVDPGAESGSLQAMTLTIAVPVA